MGISKLQKRFGRLKTLLYLRDMKNILLLTVSVILLTSCEDKVETMTKNRDRLMTQRDSLWKELGTEDSIRRVYETKTEEEGKTINAFIDTTWFNSFERSSGLLIQIQHKTSEIGMLNDEIRKYELGMK